MEEWRQKLYIC